MNLGFQFGRYSGNRSNDPTAASYMELYSHVLIDDQDPDPASLVRLLDENRGRWTILQYHHLFPTDAREFSQLVDHDVEEKYNVTPRSFERQLRLLRNRNLSVLPLREMGEYLEAYAATTLEFSEHQDSYVLTLKTKANLREDFPPLTVQLRTPWEWISIDGSENDGVYHNRTGYLNFEMIPGSEAVVQKRYSEGPVYHDQF